MIADDVNALQNATARVTDEVTLPYQLIAADDRSMTMSAEREKPSGIA